MTPSTHAGRQGDGVGDHQQRAAVEDHVVVFFQGTLDEIDQQLAFEKLGRVGWLGAGGDQRKVGHLSLRLTTSWKTSMSLRTSPKPESSLAVAKTLSMQVGPAEVGIDEQNPPAVEGQTGREIDGDRRLRHIRGAATGDEDRASGVERRRVLQAACGPGGTARQ